MLFYSPTFGHWLLVFILCFYSAFYSDTPSCVSLHASDRVI